MSVALVTDSTAYLPDAVLARYGITIVAVQVVIGGTSHDEGSDVSSESVTEALRDWRPVTTSRPSPQAFLDAYEAAAAAGATGVVSVHLSADMSGTLGSAQLASADASIPVRVVDSRTLGMAMGFPVVTGAEVAVGGGDLDAVEAAVAARCAASSLFFYVDTLEYLRRGGRIGAGAALLGSALAVKPLLEMVDGRIGLLEKVRTSSKALARLEEIACERAGSAQVDVAVHHLSSAERAAALADRLHARLPGLRELVVSEVGAVVGAHVGPGMIAVAVVPV
ncbi:MAG TPA: DegV family protein [Actinomycetes bacterium]